MEDRDKISRKTRLILILSLLLLQGTEKLGINIKHLYKYNMLQI